MNILSFEIIIEKKKRERKQPVTTMVVQTLTQNSDCYTLLKTGVSPISHLTT